MKIAILTHPLGTNYGGMLQNCALQQVLEGLGHTPITINYQFETSLKTKVLSFGKRLLLRIKGERIPLRVWLTRKEYLYITQFTRDFIKEHIKVSELFFLDKIKKQDFGDIDAIIVGSDQVWRGSNPNIEKFYLCDFVNNDIIKIAYAASFGVDYWEMTPKLTARCAKLASLFRAISVREQSGASLCKNFLGVDAQFALDPTLLLNADYYSRIIGEKEIESNKDKYLYTYVLDNAPYKTQITEKLSEKLSLNTHSVMVRKYFKEVGYSGLSDCVYPPVEQWLRGFKDADFVVTDSFHGTVFSIIFHKPFISIVNKKRGADRFVSLLSMLGLEDRLVDNADDALRQVESPIDFETTDIILDGLRKSSMTFLKDNLI